MSHVNARGLLASLVLGAGLAACAPVGLVPGVTTSISGSIQDGTYTSPDGAFSVAVPALLKPGAGIRDERLPDDGMRVEFTDDLCRVMLVERFPGPPPVQPLEAVVEANEARRLAGVAVTDMQRRLAETPYGPAVRMSYIHPAGAPCQVFQSDESGQRMVTPDARVELAVLYAGGAIYRLMYVRAPDLGRPSVLPSDLDYEAVRERGFGIPLGLQAFDQLVASLKVPAARG